MALSYARETCTTCHSESSRPAKKRHAASRRAPRGCVPYTGRVYLRTMSEPKPNLSPPEIRCLDIIHAMLERGETPSILAVARALGIGKSGAQKHMDALRAKGRLRGPRVVGEWALTRAGRRALQKTA